MPAASDAPTPAPRRGRLAPPGDPTPVENVATHLREGWNRWHRARALRAGFAQLEVRWVPRHKNTIADALARGDAVPGADAVDASPLASTA